MRPVISTRMDEWASLEVSIGSTALAEDRDARLVNPLDWLVPQDWVVVDGRYELDSGAVALYRAVKNKRFDEVRALLAAQADVTYRTEENGWTALHWAAYAFHSDDQQDMIHALCQSEGTDVNAQDNSGATPLRRIATYPAMPNNVRALLACKADPNIKDDSGESALESALAECPQEGPPPDDLMGQRCFEVAAMLREAA